MSGWPHARAALVGVAICLCTALPARSLRAAPASRTVALAVFVPNAAVGGPYKLAAFGNALAAKLAAALGRPVRSSVFGVATQLDRAIRRGRVDIAVVDPLYFIARRTRLSLQPLAVATHRGVTTRRWAMYVNASAGARPSLQGKTLAHAHSGGDDDAFVERALLGGAVKLRRFFAKTRELRTVGNALSAVKFGQADCAVAPLANNGLTRAFDLGSFLNPLLVNTDRASAALRAAVKRAALAIRQPAATLDGWRAVGAELERAMAALRRPPLAPKLIGAPFVLRAEAIRPPRARDERLAQSALGSYLGRR